jgi:hypothetical protein
MFTLLLFTMRPAHLLHCPVASRPTALTTQHRPYQQHTHTTDLACWSAPFRFEEYTISQFARVKDIHIILLVVTLVGLVAFVFMVFRPYVAKLRSQSKVFAGEGADNLLAALGRWTVVCGHH